ncbi:unnamed protein product [Clavelina lepadiformis]|uniref:Thymopoietin n=1 Tax=Clavelina lepadiformis TaxID=159417 RepID=A0ABP0FPH2_CLALP
MSNPEDLTKVQLKEELVAHGVKLPPGQALKSVYVELYNSHISKDSGEFSSDDNVVQVQRSSSSKRSKRKKKVISNSTSDLESLEHLTNAEIAAKLKELGQYTGPVIATTRKVYLKRLKEVLQENVTDDHTEYSDEESVPKVPVTRSSSKRRTMMELSENPPLVSRKSQSCTSRIAQSLHVPVVQSSSCNMPIQRSFARKPDFEITDSPKSISVSTPNLHELRSAGDFDVKQRTGRGSSPPMAIPKLRFTASPVEPAHFSAPEKLTDDLTPSWVNLSLSDISDRQSNTFSLEKFSDYEEDFDSGVDGTAKRFAKNAAFGNFDSSTATLQQSLHENTRQDNKSGSFVNRSELVPSDPRYSTYTVSMEESSQSPLKTFNLKSVQSDDERFLSPMHAAYVQSKRAKRIW